MEELNKVIDYITNTKEYQNTIKLKEQMDNNEELNNLIKEVKELQKIYIKDKSSHNKEKLDEKIKLLDNYPIYKSYNENLEVVNQMISYVNDELNDYFVKVMNESN